MAQCTTAPSRIGSRCSFLLYCPSGSQIAALTVNTKRHQWEIIGSGAAGLFPALEQLPLAESMTIASNRKTNRPGQTILGPFAACPFPSCPSSLCWMHLTGFWRNGRVVCFLGLCVGATGKGSALPTGKGKLANEDDGKRKTNERRGREKEKQRTKTKNAVGNGAVEFHSRNIDKLDKNRPT